MTYAKIILHMIVENFETINHETRLKTPIKNNHNVVISLPHVPEILL
jgi:hypothetical protein